MSRRVSAGVVLILWAVVFGCFFHARSAVALPNGFDQKKVAHRDKNFPEPKEKSLKPDVGEPVGLGAAKMTEAK